MRPEDRKSYLDASESVPGSPAEDLRPFETFMHECLDATLGEYLSVLREVLPAPDPTPGGATAKPVYHVAN